MNLTAGVGACSEYRVEKDLDYGGADLSQTGALAAEDEGACCAACERNRLCNAVTYVLASQQCWLKARRRSPRQGAPGEMVSMYRARLKPSARRLSSVFGGGYGAARPPRESLTAHRVGFPRARGLGLSYAGGWRSRGADETLAKYQLVELASSTWRHARWGAWGWPAVRLWLGHPGETTAPPSVSWRVGWVHEGERHGAGASGTTLLCSSAAWPRSDAVNASWRRQWCRGRSAQSLPGTAALGAGRGMPGGGGHGGGGGGSVVLWTSTVGRAKPGAARATTVEKVELPGADRSRPILHHRPLLPGAAVARTRCAGISTSGGYVSGGGTSDGRCALFIAAGALPSSSAAVHSIAAEVRGRGYPLVLSTTPMCALGTKPLATGAAPGSADEAPAMGGGAFGSDASVACFRSLTPLTAAAGTMGAGEVGETGPGSVLGGVGDDKDAAVPAGTLVEATAGLSLDVPSESSPPWRAFTYAGVSFVALAASHPLGPGSAQRDFVMDRARVKKRAMAKGAAGAANWLVLLSAALPRGGGGGGGPAGEDALRRLAAEAGAQLLVTDLIAESEKSGAATGLPWPPHGGRDGRGGAEAGGGAAARPTVVQVGGRGAAELYARVLLVGGASPHDERQHLCVERVRAADGHVVDRVRVPAAPRRSVAGAQGRARA